jgi:hypothetical protein
MEKVQVGGSSRIRHVSSSDQPRNATDKTLATFRRLLPADIKFDFIDGRFPDAPAAGIELFFEPPYFQHFASGTVEDLESSHEWLLKYIKDNGPYDGVMSFSQGCSFASSLLLYHQIRNPNTPPPFKVAIFICGGLPLHALPGLGFEVSTEAIEISQRSAYLLNLQSSSEAILRDGIKRWATGYDASGTPDKSNVFGFNFEMIEKEKLIQIPTVHVYGSKDPRYPAGVTLAHFCKEDERRVFNHGGGHEIPRRTEVSEKIASLVKWCATMAES